MSALGDSPTGCVSQQSCCCVARGATATTGMKTPKISRNVSAAAAAIAPRRAGAIALDGRERCKRAAGGGRGGGGELETDEDAHAYGEEAAEEEEGEEEEGEEEEAANQDGGGRAGRGNGRRRGRECGGGRRRRRRTRGSTGVVCDMACAIMRSGTLHSGCLGGCGAATFKLRRNGCGRGRC